MRTLVDWTLEDNMVDYLFFCATLTGRRWDHTHLHKQEWKRPTPVQGRLSQAHTDVGRVILGEWVLVVWVKVQSLVRLCHHSAFHWWYAQCTARTLLSDELLSCCAVSTNECFDLRRHAITLDGRVTIEWSRCIGSIAGLAGERVGPLWQS